MRAFGSVFRRFGVLLGGVVLLGLTTATPALADWRRAESDRFIVYSDGSEGTLREMVQHLETYDRMLRLLMNLPMDETPPRKLPVYLVQSHRGLEAVMFGAPDELQGFYARGEDDIFAVAMRRGDDERVLLHEYAHHFMLQNFPAGYPAWFIEGFAEYFSTTSIRPGRVTVGLPEQNSARWLAYGDSWVSMTDILSKTFSQVQKGRETYYPLSWLMTHWFLSEPSRTAQLQTYLIDIGKGADPVEAMEKATGMTVDVLQRNLRTTLNGQARIRTISYAFPQASMTITPMPPSADALLLIGQRVKSRVPEDQRAVLLQQVRAAAARFPEDSLAQTVLARTELKIGDHAAGVAVLDDLLKREPADVDGLQLLASARMSEAEEAEDDGEAIRLRVEARSLLSRAFAADDANYSTLILLVQNRRVAPDYPNDNDLNTLALAYDLAPQLPSIRLNLAATLAFRGRAAEAKALLQPVLNDPHDRGSGLAARAIIARADAGEGSRSILEQGASEDEDTAPQTGAEPENPVTPKP